MKVWRLTGRGRVRKRVLTATLAATSVLCAGCGSGGATVAGFGRLVPIGAGLDGPAGLAATVYATGLPTMSAFALDSEGRLWVTTSAATQHARDGVYVVSKPGASPVKVISGLKGPLGLTWSGDELYVASIGRVDRFGGLDGTRFAVHSTILTEPSGHGWNDNIVRAPDGRLVMSISAPCDHCTPKSSWAAAIVSFRPDGSDARILAKAVRAGYGLAYYPGTSDLFVSMNQRNDLGARTPGDWLAVVRHGQNWGFPKCYGQGGTVCRGVPAPVAVLDKHAAAGGVAIVTGSLGESVGDAALVAEWSLGKVERVELTRSGSTYKGTTAAFLTGLKDPLPVLTTGDGAVLVGDWTTGTVYRIARR
jgi:glucose/arabinose dehydrogenase